MTTMTDWEPVDAQRIADRLGVALDTVHTWKKRTKRGEGVGMPEPRWTFGNVPVWEWTEVLVWAGRTGRLPARPELHAAFERLSGEDAVAERRGGRLTEEQRRAIARPVKVRRRVARARHLPLGKES